MTQSDPQPLLTPAQVERQKRLKRFNRLTIYLPIGVLLVLVIGVTALLLWLTLFTTAESTAEWRQFSSATADIVIILAVLPLMFFAAVLPILAAGWFWYTSGNRRPVERWLQKWLWRTDTFVENSAQKVGDTGAKVASASIKYRESTTAVGRVVERLTGWVLPAKKSDSNSF